MKIWTCKKCGNKFEPKIKTRICNSCRNTHCIDCNTKFHDSKKADRQRCDKCEVKHKRQLSKQWYKENKDRKRKYDEKRRNEKRYLYREASKRFNKNNPDKKNLNTNIRRRRHRQATPAWANKFIIKEIYSLSQIRTKLTGIKWHVDHIIPLKNDLVCGLHVHENLQVITEAENLAKHNHYSFEHNGSM